MTQQTHTKREEWVIWNGVMGFVDMVAVGTVEVDADGVRRARLKAPYDMVGPFNLDELYARHFVHFAACIVMSREHWRTEGASLRREASAKRREVAERFRREGYAHARGKGWQDFAGAAQGPARASIHRYRSLLGLPTETAPSRSAINSAFRRLARRAHPDAGGSHEAFVRLAQARDALLADALS